MINCKGKSLNDSFPQAGSCSPTGCRGITIGRQYVNRRVEGPSRLELQLDTPASNLGERLGDLQQANARPGADVVWARCQIVLDAAYCQCFGNITDIDIISNDTAVAPDNQRPVEIISDRKSTRLNSSHLGISYAVF